MINYFLAADCKIDCKRDCKRLTNHSIMFFIKNILQFESCYETSIDCMIYSILLFQTETLNSYRLCERVFAKDWESQLVYSQSIILRLTINQNESIKMLNANLESTAITCRTTKSNEYLWWNSTTISISSRSL